MPTTDRRLAARRKAWGRGPMILRFDPGAGENLARPPETSPLDSAPAVDPTNEARTPAILGLRLVNDGDFAIDALSFPSSPQIEQSADTDQTSQPSPLPRTKRIIIHKSHEQPAAPLLRVFAPSDNQVAKGPRMRVSLS